MKAITLHQPFASFIPWGFKGPETRSWPCPPALIGKRLAIHAAGSLPGYAKELCFTEPFSSVLGLHLRENQAGDFYLSEVLKRLPLGCVIATCIVDRCVRTEDVRVVSRDYTDTPLLWVTEMEYAFGDYRPGRWAWVLRDIVPLPKPVPTRGFQRIWNWTVPADVQDWLTTQEESR
ncbi:MAG: hypothetical protein ACRYFS_24575 [Janthinobacterium lividum]